MLFKQLLTAAVVAIGLSQSQVNAQFYNSGCSSCASSPAPVAMAQTTCAPVVPVQSTCYQTVPVTTYKRERQTVKEPYYTTAYENRKVTVLEPVTRQRTVEVPTVSYRTVTENRTTQRDLGRWQTNYQPIAKCAPCQVDPRPGLIGWLNRTGYSFRSSFIPNYRTTRQYVPRRVVCNTPVTRQVAVRGTKKVVVNETHMVARTKTERVEVQKLAFREKEVTVMRPTVAYQTVPIGTQTAYGYGGGALAYGYGGGSLAYGSPYGYGSGIAYIEDEDDARTANRPERDSNFDEPRTARPFPEDIDRERNFNRTEADTEDSGFRRSAYERDLPPAGTAPKATPNPFPNDAPGFPSTRRDTRDPRDSRIQPAAYRPPTDRRTTARGWKAARPSAASRTAAVDRRSENAVSMND